MKSRLTGFSVFGPDASSPQLHVFELFHENTKLRPGLMPLPPDEFHIAATQSRPRSWRPKRYPNAPSVHLPAPELAPWKSLSWLDLIRGRRTSRLFEGPALPLVSVSAILYSAYGVTGSAPDTPGDVPVHRPSPSAGATFPLEIYAALNLSDVPPSGLYHYSPSDHTLAQLSPLNPAPMLGRMCLEGDGIRSAPLVLIITAVFRHTTTKYGDRGYRYVLLEAGHTAQTIVLAATSLGLATLPLGGFIDDEFNDWIGIDGVNEAVCYMIGIGEPAG